MAEKENNIMKETFSLDEVQFDSDDDEFEYDPVTNKFVLKNEVLSKSNQVKASLEQLQPLKKDPLEAEDEIDTDEEKDILKGIKDEIEGKVRMEMKDELQLYQAKLLALESGELPGTKTEDSTETNGTDQAEVDPKLKEALDKMQKLDRILRKKVRREREVKRDRLLLERRLKEEIAAMQQGASNFKEIKTNTEKFLALEPPPSHNEGITLDYEEEEDIPPLFQTQIDDTDIKPKGRKNLIKIEAGEKTPTGSESKMSNEESKSRTESVASGDGKKNKNSNKNFIKRNKELAAAANDVIAMTDEEKKRLQDLLLDIDQLDELDGIEAADSSIFQLALNPGDGFIPDDVEFKSLTNIDEKLKSIIPEDDYTSISGMGGSQFSTPRPALFTRVGVKSTANLLDGFGEQVLFETKEERELKAKLESIEKKLEKFKTPTNGESDVSSEYHLSDEQLDDLLNQCVRSMSRTSAMETPDDSTARCEVSSRQMLMENPPKLSEDQLQQLLSEAYFPMSSKLLALKEEEEDDEELSIISSDTWKAIVDHRLEDDNNDSASTDTARQNMSQNAYCYDKEDSLSQIYKCDDILAGKEELTDEFPNNTIAPRLQNSNQRSLLKDIDKFPKISKRTYTNPHKSSTRSSVSENINQANSTAYKRDGDLQAFSDQLRLPVIQSNSFLVRTSQGLNNKSSPSRVNSSSKDPIPMVRNNLSDISLTSFNDENWENSNEDKVLSCDMKKDNRNKDSFQPRPPSSSQ